MYFSQVNYQVRRWIGERLIKLGLWVSGCFSNNLYRYAKDEIDLWNNSAATEVDKDGYEMERLMNDHVLLMVAMDSFGGHSGFSHSIMLNRYNKLANFEPINPISFDNDQWADVMGDSKGPLQHKKVSRLFKDRTGKMYTIDRFIFEEPVKGSENNGKENWIGFTTGPSFGLVNSRQDVFKQEHVKVRPSGEPHPKLDNFYYTFVDAEQERAVITNYQEFHRNDSQP